MFDDYDRYERYLKEQIMELKDIDTIQYEIIKKELEFDNNETNSFLIFNDSEIPLYVLISELSDDDFKYKELDTKTFQLHILKYNEYVYVPREKYFSVLSLKNIEQIQFVKIILENQLIDNFETSNINNKEFIEINKKIKNIEEYEVILYDTLSSNIKELINSFEIEIGKYKITLLLEQ
jgi:hypothetical protein